MSAVADAPSLPPIAGSLRPSFAGALGTELLKIRRQRMAWILLLFFVLVCAISLAAFVAGGRGPVLLHASPAGFYFDYLAAGQALYSTVGGIVLLLLSSRLVGMEYAAGTIRVVLARGTGRLQLLAAQWAAMAVVALLLLIGFVVVWVTTLLAVTQRWQGSFLSLSSIPTGWTDTWINLGMVLLSAGVCILLGTAAAAVGRSLAFGVGVAMGFFPADNFLTIVLGLLYRLTHQGVWKQITLYLLGPNLNVLPNLLQTDHSVPSTAVSPLGSVDATHAWLVVAAWSLLLLGSTVLLTWRQDVLQ